VNFSLNLFVAYEWNIFKSSFVLIKWFAWYAVSIQFLCWSHLLIYSLYNKSFDIVNKWLSPSTVLFMSSLILINFLFDGSHYNNFYLPIFRNSNLFMSFIISSDTWIISLFGTAPTEIPFIKSAKQQAKSVALAVSVQITLPPVNLAAWN